MGHRIDLFCADLRQKLTIIESGLQGLKAKVEANEVHVERGSGRAGWRTKPTGPMNHIAQMWANLMLSFEATYGPAAHGKLKLGPFELSIGERLLWREGVVLPLGGRALDLLIYLAERPGEVIAKQELTDHVWSDVTVEEGSIRVQVAAIRKALRDGQFGNRYIANIKGRGYSFVGNTTRGSESRKLRWQRVRWPHRHRCEKWPDRRCVSMLNDFWWKSPNRAACADIVSKFTKERALFDKYRRNCSTYAQRG
jgi:DNA-binding winged helix-turn-helix (wHTH) protein